MSTRAVIIRKNAAGELEYGQTKYDGMNNTALLNENFKSSDVVDKLFARMSKRGILSLGCGLECTDWYDEGDTYNYGCFVPAADDLMPHALRQFFLSYLDFAEFASIWDGDKWINFDTHNVDACSAFLLRLFGFNHEEEAPVTKRTCVIPAPLAQDGVPPAPLPSTGTCAPAR